MINVFASLVSEKKEVENILSHIPTTDIITRISFQNRLEEIQKELAQLPAEANASETVKITFRGAPVVGTHGIFVDFATKAASIFSDAFTAIMAGNEDLRYMGPIPNKQQNRLLITGIAIGSFGFEFELPQDSDNQEDLFLQEKKAASAMKKMQNLFIKSTQGTDDDLSEIVDEIHPRAVKKVAEFFEYLIQQQAWCGMEFRKQSFKFLNLSEIQTSFDRIKEENIKISENEYTGCFQGILPKGRTFEFKDSNTNNVIKGKIDVAIEDPGELNRTFLGKHVKTRFTVIQVGHGKPNFTLKKIDDITHLT